MAVATRVTRLLSACMARAKYHDSSYKRRDARRMLLGSFRMHSYGIRILVKIGEEVNRSRFFRAADEEGR